MTIKWNHKTLAQTILATVDAMPSEGNVRLLTEAFAACEREGMRRAAEIVREEGRKWPVPANVNMHGATAALANAILAALP